MLKHTVLKTLFKKSVLVAGLACLPLVTHANLLQRDDLQKFIRNMVAQHKFDADKLENIFSQVQLKDSIIEAISRPAEKKPWFQYRPIFITNSRINGGVKFWDKNREILARAEKEYGVPAEIITAIIGVETRYGRHAGRYKVIDSLSTLAFDYPPRSKFFRSELEQYLLMTREEGVDPLSVYGSYAGAMGQPQFISSSYRRYAIDFDGDGKRDIWKNSADAIGSVANYLSTHGWQTGKGITSRLNLAKEPEDKTIFNRSLKPYVKAAELSQAGVALPSQLPDDEMVTLMSLQGKKGSEYWLGQNNFYVITRYNHSALYAMAVYQLSQAIRKKRYA
jgi:membrane-bound lytic murein transglycosylase B